MKKIIVLSLILVAFCGQVKSQVYGDKISFGQGNFFLNGSFISFQQTREIMSVNEEASLYLKRARTNRTWSSILSYPGYFVVGWGLGGLLGGVPFGETAPYLGAGLGLIAGSVLLDFGFSKNANLAVNVYNSSFPMGSKPIDVRLQAGMTSTGMGLRLSF